MLATLNAILPVFLVIALGFVLRRQKIVGEEIWRAAEHLCYYVLFPALLIKTLSVADLTSIPIGAIAGVLLLASGAMVVLLLTFKWLFPTAMGMTDASFASVFQGVTRWHAFIALSIVGPLYGDEGVALIAICMAVLVPVLNAINITALAVYGDAEMEGSSILMTVITNPIIIACTIGLLLNLLSIGLPGPLYRSFDIVSSGALGLSLLVIGAGIRLSLLTSTGGLVSFAVLLRLVVMPALMLGFSFILEVDGLARVIVVISGAVPCAASSYVLAKQMGADAPMMANILTLQVLVAIITLPLAVTIAQAVS